MTPNCSHPGCKRVTRDNSSLCWQHRDAAHTRVTAKRGVPAVELSGPPSVLVPRSGESASYYAATEAKHFDPAAPGSTFTEPGVTDLDKLLELAEVQRGSLDGDDRDEFVMLGSPPESFRDDVRYLHVSVSGRVGVLHSVGLPADTTVRMVRKHALSPVSAVITSPSLPDTRDATVIIGPGDDGGEVLYTAHPGVPVPSYDADPLSAYEGAELPLSAVRDIVGGDLWLNAEVVGSQSTP